MWTTVRTAWFWLAIPLAILYILPILGSGFSGEDIYRSVISGLVAGTHAPAFAALGDVVRAGDQALRAPLQVGLLAFWLLNPPAGAVNVVQMSLVVLNVATFSLVAGRFFRDARFGALTSVCLLATIQFRLGDDPLLGSSITSTVGCELILLAILAFQVANGTATRAIVAGVTFAAAVLADPSGIALVGLMPILAWMSGGTLPRRVACGSIYLTAGVALLVASGLWGFGIDRAPSLPVVVGQVFAAIPLVYRSLRPLIPHGDVPFTVDTRFLGQTGAGIVGVLLAGGVLAVAYASGKQLRGAEMRRAWPHLIVTGLCLWLLPACLGSQFHVPLADPLPVIYVQSFGVALLIASIVAWCASSLRTERARGIALASAALLLATTVLGNVASERVVIAKNVKTDAVRRLFAEASGSQLASYLPPNATIALNPRDYPFIFKQPDWRNASYFLRRYLGISGETISERDLEDGTLCASRGLGCRARRDDIWSIRAFGGPDGLRQLVAGRYAAVVGKRVQVDRAVGYLAYQGSELRDVGLARLKVGGRGLASSGEAVGGAATLALATRTCGPVDEELAFTPSAPTVAWGNGFLANLTFNPSRITKGYALEFVPVRPYPWRFAGSTSELEVERDACVQTPLRVTFDAYAPEPTFLLLRAAGMREILTVSQLQTAVTFDLPPSRENPARLTIESGSAMASPDEMSPRYRNAAPLDVRLLVLSPQAQYVGAGDRE